MATTVFLSLPAHGHINPSLPVIAELVRRGEQVTYFAVERFRAAIEATGATFRNYSEAYKDFDPATQYGGPFGLMASSATLTRELLPTLLPQVRDINPDYLMTDATSLMGNVVQQITRLPAVSFTATMSLTPKVMRQRQKFSPSPWQTLAGIHHLFGYYCTMMGLRQQYGIKIPSVVDFFSNEQALVLVFTSRSFQPFGATYPPHFRFVGPSVAPRPDTSNFPFEQLRRDVPLIYISLGTIFNQNLAFFRACYAAFGDGPYQVVMATGTKLDPAQIGAPPANFVVRPYVPQLELLQQADLFFTHAGMNSASESLLYGVPMVVIPQMGDQFFVANRLLEIGAAVGLSNAEISTERIRQAAVEVLHNPDYRRCAHEVGDTLLGAGGYLRAADEILAAMPRGEPQRAT